MLSLKVQPRRLVLVGSILVDILMYVERLPERGGDAIARHSLLTSGGGMNILAGAARLGLSACYAGRVGDGPMGEQVLTDLTRAGIPLLLPRISGADTGFDIGLVEADGERTFVTSPGTESRLELADVRSIQLQPGDAVYISGYDLGYPVSGATLAAWLPDLPDNILLIIDPGPLVAEIPATRLERILARTNILSLNEREIGLLTGITAIPQAAQALVSRLAPDASVIARAGAQGCWLTSRTQEPLHLPGRSARVVDTTGAGDAHVAALLARLALGDDLACAARIANVAASLSVERIGPATCPTLPELQAALVLQPWYASLQ
jgi:sugar/nucleoside kinase (ribokinase family)